MRNFKKPACKLELNETIDNRTVLIQINAIQNVLFFRLCSILKINALWNLKSKSGSTLLSIILAMSILSIVGMGIIAATMNNTNQAIYLKNYETAYYDSESALRMGVEAIKKASTIELTKLKTAGAKQLGTSYMTNVRTTALSLLPQDLILDSNGITRIFITIPNTGTKVSQFKIEAIGKEANLTRKTSIIMSLSGSQSTVMSPFPYGMIVGGDMSIDQTKNNATTKITLSPEGIVDGAIDASKPSITNVTYTLPAGMTWWDAVKTGLEQRFETIAEGSATTSGMIIDINASGASYPNETVVISKNSNGTYKVGTLTLSSLENHVLLVKGHVVFDPSVDFDIGDKTKNLMIYATGNITINKSSSSSNGVADPLFIFSGETIELIENKSNGTPEYNLMAYANEMKYSNPYNGNTTLIFTGQLLIKNDFSFGSINGSINIIIKYNYTSVPNFFNEMNELIYSNTISGVSGDSLPTGNLFTEGKIIETKN